MNKHLALKTIQLYVDSELSPAKIAAVQTHLATCSICRRHVEGLQQTEMLLRRAARLATPADFTAQVMARLQKQTPVQIWANGNGRWLAWVAGLAGLIILGLALLEVLASRPIQVDWSQLLLATTDWNGFFLATTVWPNQALQVSGEILAALGSGLTRSWQGLSAMGDTALPLALALLALGGFVQGMRWLSQLNEIQKSGVKAGL